MKGESVLTSHTEFRDRIQHITTLSRQVNGNDKQKILDMIKEHTKEIQHLYNENNTHWAIETADLIVLCYELLLMEDMDIDEVFNKCLPRFDKKLNQMLKEGKSK
jgi:phosphoribosyl-ATP pyrophosphohydrolase